ncbi:MAG: hypothetical protein EAZ85_05040 [Bacteroidetes bacterium]|nr:MAG: hypothetical protein EAZ85_05040 [Bacteroidota bacterium]TAG85755.1 MAG: hypothetical protein EAZ20_14275 [Bacteroidota bacterium]
MKKLVLLSALFVVAFLCNLNAQNIEKDIVGTWKLIDIRLTDPAGKPMKLTADMKKELAEAKKMFMGESPLTFEFKGGKMNTVPAEGEAQPYKITDGKFLNVETTGEQQPMKNVPVAIVKGNLEMAPMPSEDGKLFFMVFKKQ